MATVPTATATPAPPRQGRMTLEEFMRLPDDGYKYELVDGELKVSPSGLEQEAIGARLITYLSNHILPRSMGRVYGSNAGYRLPNGNVRAPDILPLTHGYPNPERR